MPAPASVSVTTAGVICVEPTPTGGQRGFLILSRQDDDERRVYLSIGTQDFDVEDAALWVDAGERIILTTEAQLWPLVSRGIFAKIATGTAISLQIQEG